MTQPWPELSYVAWRDTCSTLQLWTQVVGKIRLAQTPWLNHSWHVPLYVTARGLPRAGLPQKARLCDLVQRGVGRGGGGAPLDLHRQRAGAPAQPHAVD